MSEKILQQILDELKEVKKEVSNVKQEQKKTNERLTNIESKQNIIYEQTGKLTEYHTETMAGFQNLATKADLEYFDKKITEHDREIFKIKNQV